MNDKFYVLLDISDRKVAPVGPVLQETTGVFIADTVAGLPDVVIVMEVPNREQLAKLTNQAIASADTMTELTNQAVASLGTMTEDIHRVPAREKLNKRVFPKVSSLNRRSGKRAGQRRVVSAT